MLYSGGSQGKKWTRFPKFEYNSYFYVSKNYWDAVCFIPKQTITLMGFGWLNQYEKQSFNLTFKIIVDSTEYPECKVDITQDMLEEPKPEDLSKNTFLIDLEKTGGQHIDVQAGQKIHLLAKTSRENQNDVRFYYGYDGYHPEKIEGQDYDFDVKNSDHN